MIRVDTAIIRTNSDTGIVTIVVYTPENDLTSGQEGIGQTLSEALFDLAANIEEAECQVY